MIVANEDILRTTGVLYKYRAGRPDDLFTIVNTMEEARKWLGIEESASESGLES